jgi:hypothetical protein
MRVFVAGASGAIGIRLVPLLVTAGHEVIGTFVSPGHDERIRALGAKPVALDVLDAPATRRAVIEARPDAIIHEATALASMRWSRNLDRSFARTNRIRTEGTDTLLAAARETGVRRFVAQSFASYRYAREGSWVKTEDDPLDPDPPATARQTNAAMAHLDEGTALAGRADRGRRHDRDGDAVAWCRQRQSEEGTRLDATLSKLAAGLRGRIRPSRPALTVPLGPADGGFAVTAPWALAAVARSRRGCCRSRR